jgi:hypothetical protein
MKRNALYWDVRPPPVTQEINNMGADCTFCSNNFRRLHQVRI